MFMTPDQKREESDNYLREAIMSALQPGIGAGGGVDPLKDLVALDSPVYPTVGLSKKDKWFPSSPGEENLYRFVRTKRGSDSVT